ncbi:MAG: MlaD family protein [Synechococcaceae cyanobacterium]|nr:MlaD family protein [Synechococcaceae cyanobacterium]
MRRSVREAIVGFSLLAAISSGVGLSLWLRGLSLTRQYWSVQARFAQAGGLAVRSPVVFRGVIVGSVRSVQVTPDAVIADLEITNSSLRLPLPASAEIGQVSMLGGDSQVALVSTGKSLGADAPSPRSSRCDRSRMLCDGARIIGSEGASLGSLTTLMYRLLDEVDREQLVAKVTKVATSVDATSKEATSFLRDGRGLISDGKGLVSNLEASVQKAQPTITNLNASSAHLRQLLAALDNPKVVSELQQTVANAERLTAQWEAVGGDVNKLTGDPQFMDGLRNVTVGLGKFFEELYPAQTGAARDRAARQNERTSAPTQP